jgi:aspartate aminotransferase-like enzyme
MFFELMQRIQCKLSSLLKTEGPVIILPSSGTGALETLCSNLISEGDRVLSVSCGVFGERFREIARRWGASIIPLDFPYGEPVDPQKVLEVLKAEKDIKTVLLTHNETSTGVVNPIRDIIAGIEGPEKPMILMDAVSSLGAMPCYPQEWGVDGLASCSQKGLMTAPGLGVVWLSERAWENVRSNEDRKGYYFDLLLHREYLEKEYPQNPFTPPVSLYENLDHSLSYILDQTPEGWFSLRKKISRTFISGISAMGLAPLVKNVNARSSGVSSVLFPNSTALAVQKSLESMGIIASGGQGSLKGNIMRFAHYSEQQWPDMAMLLGCIFGALCENDIPADPDFISTAWNSWKEAK